MCLFHYLCRQTFPVMANTIFNTAQQDLLNMMAFVKSPEALNELKKVIAGYFANKINESVDDMWKSGELTEKKFENFKTLHQRTRYRQ